MRIRGGEEGWEGGRVNGLEIVVGLKNRWEGGNQISE